MPTRNVDRLVRAARRAVTFLGNQAAGNGLNGPHDDLTIGRELHAALADFLDVPTYAELPRLDEALMDATLDALRSER